MNEKIHTLAHELNEDVSASLQTLQTRLARVERELDLECQNLRSLVDSRDPDLNRQLDALSHSITDLHESLAEVRGHLGNAQNESHQLEDATNVVELKRPSTKASTNTLGLTPREIERRRHEEDFSLSSIVRALFMADEPAQRFNTTTR
ncbi:MAG: hypothetical protein AAGC74_13065 [Verrucomicrobiota bacterium]